MRPLTSEEKARCTNARKRANKALREQRRAIGVKLRDLPESSRIGEVLLFEFESIRDIKGYPVTVSLNGNEMVLNYELLRCFDRSLKNRIKSIKIVWRDNCPVLLIDHHTRYWSKDVGSIELYELPAYQRELLTDLPIVEI